MPRLDHVLDRLTALFGREPDRPIEIRFATEPEPAERLGWAIVNLFGKTRVAGFLSAERHFGQDWARIDPPAGPTRYQHPSSVWGWTPCTEEAARTAAAACDDPAPLQRWELPKPGPRQPADRPAAAGRDDGDPWREPPF